MDTEAKLVESPAQQHDDPMPSVQRTVSASESSLHRRRGTVIADDGTVLTEKSSEEAVVRRPEHTPQRGNTARSLSQRVKELLEPEKKLGKEPTYRESIMAIVKASWINLLIVFIPIAWALHLSSAASDTVVFVMAFLAILPLAKLLGFATEELAMRVGQTLGGLLNATLGNVVELIVAIIAATKCELQVVQSSLLGSILSNLLLVLGMCFFFGGLRFSEQAFKPMGTQTNSSLLLVSTIIILIPSAYHAAFGQELGSVAELPNVLSMSRGAAVITLVIYIAYLTFQLFTHTHVYAEGPERPPEPKPLWGDHKLFKQAKSVQSPVAAQNETNVETAGASELEEEIPSINVPSCIVLLIAVTVLVAFTAEFLVDSISGLTEAHPDISQAWVGLILLPIAGNAAEHVTAVTVAVKDKLDLSIGVAVGSSIQIALFVIPLLVIICWGMDKPLTLLFDPFQAVVLFLTVLITNSTMNDNRSNWLEGFILICIYIIIAVSAWYYPAGQTSTAALLDTCT